MQKHDGIEECREAFLETFEGVQGKKWMAVVWVENEDGELVCHRTTCEFPIARFPESIRLLRSVLNEEMGTVEPAPLPKIQRFNFLDRDGGNHVGGE